MMRFDVLTLTARDPLGLRAFYADTLGLPTQAEGGALNVQVGGTQLCFEPGNGGVYHFAFDVPPTRFAESVAWLRARVPLMADKRGQTEFHSADWNADMVYFLDPAGNIAELIARHDRHGLGDRAPFAAHHLLCVSEIGIAADDMAAQIASLSAKTGAGAYGDVSPTFHPIGQVTHDYAALFIVVPAGRIWFPDTGVPAAALPVRVQGQGVNGAFDIACAAQSDIG